ncbi:MAG TPA: hypothetical protein VL306_01380 [Methylomirabilota bacterium]|nr:hypothetical protein [Methylomirabilota bacterium]
MRILYHGKISKTLALGLLVSQVVLISNVLLIPRPAQAFLGIGDFTFNTEVANWYDVFKDIGLGAAQRIAISYANKYISQFVDKLIDKYRIKDYLAYDKVLSGYYLNKYIYEHVADPDLRAIYNALATDINARTTVTDANGQTKPFLAALKQKLDQYYIDQGGISSSNIYNPSTYATDEQYFAAAQAYFSNPPEYTQERLYGEFGDQVAAANSAASQEIGNGQGLKSDRSNPNGIAPHVCVGGFRYPGKYLVDPNSSNSTQADYPKDPITDEATCTLAQGQWQVDAQGILTSAIQNPSAFIHDFATNAIKEIFSNNFEMHDNLYTTIGSLLGNFIFNKLNLDKSGGTFNEAGSAYVISNGETSPIKEIDLDGDNIPDGEDGNGDGQLATFGFDNCYHGQNNKLNDTVLSCKPSGSVSSSPYFTPICQAIDNGVVALTTYANFINTYADHLQNGARLKDTYIPSILAQPVGDFSQLNFSDQSGGTTDNFVNKANADIWARKSGEVNTAVDAISNSIQAYHSSYFDSMEISINQYAHFMSAIQQSLQKDQDLDLQTGSGSGGGGLENLMIKTAYTLRYLSYIKGVIGKCDSANLNVVASAPAPEIVDPGTGAAGGAGTTCDDIPTAIACTVPNHIDVVQRVISYLTSQGISMAGNCGAFEITKRVAWALRNEGAGLLVTFHSSACNGYASDIIAYPDDSQVDILGDTGGANNPQWGPFPSQNENGVHFASPFDPGDPAGSY